MWRVRSTTVGEKLCGNLLGFFIHQLLLPGEAVTLLYLIFLFFA
jgi:hypothetical protein